MNFANLNDKDLGTKIQIEEECYSKKTSYIFIPNPLVDPDLSNRQKLLNQVIKQIQQEDPNLTESVEKYTKSIEI